MVGLHLLLAPVCTVVKPVEHEVVRHPSPFLGAVSPQVDAMIDWWKDKGLTRKSSFLARSWYSASCSGSSPVMDGTSAKATL